MPQLASTSHLLPELIAKDNLTSLPSATPQSTEQEFKEKKKLEYFTYQTIAPRLKQLIDKWKGEVAEVESNRKLRNIDLSPRKLREEGKLLPDETLIPIRLVDTNITREQPSYINYIKNSPRVAVFHCIDNPQQDCQALEAEYTRVMTYPEWDIPLQRCIDGAQTHGFDYVEVVFDPAKPGHVAIEHVGKDNLYYNKDSISLQANTVIIRRYSFSNGEVEDAIHRYNFDSEQAEKILNYNSGDDKKDINTFIYKALIKLDGCVYTAWLCPDRCDDWLKKPAPLYLGMQSKITKNVVQPASPMGAMGMLGGMMGGLGLRQQPQVKQVTTLEDQKVEVFPIFTFIYKENEEQQITKKKGRVFLDKHKQEGQTAIASSFVNGLVRASKVYGSVEGNDPGDTSPPKQIDSPLVNGGIYDKAIRFWGFPYPDPSMLNGLQYFDVSNSQEVGQVNFAVANRKDSRKTATEIGAAQEQSTMLSSNQVSLLSTFLRLVYSFSWQIVQNRAINGHITFLAVPTPKINPLTQVTDIIYVNDVKTIQLKYDIRPSGDIDVVKRQQKLAQLKQDYAIFAQTPLAPEFLKEMIRTGYPDQATKWVPFFEQENLKNQVIQKFLMLSQMLTTQIPPQLMQQLPPQITMQLQQLMMEGQQALQPLPQATNNMQQQSPQPNQPPQPSTM